MTSTNRRTLLLSGTAVAALALGGCPSSTGTSTTVQGIIDWLKTNCKFSTTADMVVQVILTVVAGFNAAAGAAAAVAVAVAQQVEKAICDAVTVQTAQMGLQAAPLEGKEITVVVNGKPVVGTYGGVK